MGWLKNLRPRGFGLVEMSAILRKVSFQVITEKEGEIQPKDSLTLQTPEEKRQKTMTLADYEKVLSRLLFLKII